MNKTKFRNKLGEHEVEWKTSIKYLGVQLNRRFSFGEHLKIAAVKAIECGANLARLMPDIGGPREAKRRLVASVAHSKLLYAGLRLCKTMLSRGNSSRRRDLSR